MANESADAVAMQLARDDKAVSFLANQVLVEARNHVFRELRLIGVVVATVLSLLGLTTWGSIDGKVEAQVAKAVKEREDALEKTKNDWMMKLAENTYQAEQSGAQLEEVKKTTERLKSEAATTLRVIKDELEIVRKESGMAQAYLLTVRSGPPSEGGGAELVFGKLPRKFFAISGTNARSFGLGKDTPSGGLFTTALDGACDDKECDADKNGRLSLKEIAHVSRQKTLAANQEPAFGGEDLELFSLSDLGPGEKPERKVFAILIGLAQVDPNAYGGWNGGLKGPEKDLERIGTRLNGSNRLLASEVSVTKLKNGEATQANINLEIAALKPRIKADDIVLLLFSGHCARRTDQTGEFSDGQRKMLGAFDGLMDLPGVVKALSELGAGHVVAIVDG